MILRFQMKTAFRVIAASVVIGGVVIVLPSMDAVHSAPLPAAASYYPFVGQWKGQGQLREGGKAPISLTLSLTCNKASAGWAVRCDLTAKNDKIAISESDLMGVDPVTGKGHWYAVSNQGETHDHVTEWVSSSEMKASYSWMQNGKRMEEHITVQFPRKKSLEFRSVVSADGKEVGVFSGKLKR
jgi:hypothetical protein